MIKKQKLSKATSCEACRRSKVRCEKVFPCARCVRLGNDCVDPQVANAAAAAAAAAATAQLLQQVPMLPPAWAGSAAAAHHYQQHQYYHYQQQHLYLQQQQLATGEPAAALPRVEERPAPAGRCAADGAGDTIQELMHVGKEVDMTRPRKAPMMESPLPVCKEKAMSFLVTMALVQEKRATYCGVVAHIVRSLSHAMGLEMDALGPLLRNALPAPSNFQSFVHGCVENAVHPYCKGFFTDAFATFSWTSIGGVDRIYINRPFAELFQGEEALNEELLRGNSSPRAMILRIIHALDRAEVDRLLDYCFFISAEECCEAVHVLRCQSYNTGRSFMALVRFRAACWHQGFYYNGTISFQPLPLPVSLFAYRHSEWLPARAPDSGRTSSTAALLQHGDVPFLGRAGGVGAGAMVVRRGGGKGKRAAGGGGAKRGPPPPPPPSPAGSGSVASSSLSGLEAQAEHCALADGRGDGGGSSSGGTSGSEEEDGAGFEEAEGAGEGEVLYVHFPGPKDSEWPRVGNERQGAAAAAAAAPTPEAIGSAAASCSDASSFCTFSSLFPSAASSVAPPVAAAAPVGANQTARAGGMEPELPPHQQPGRGFLPMPMGALLLPRKGLAGRRGGGDGGGDGAEGLAFMSALPNTAKHPLAKLAPAGGGADRPGAWSPTKPQHPPPPALPLPQQQQRTRFAVSVMAGAAIGEAEGGVAFNGQGGASGPAYGAPATAISHAAPGGNTACGAGTASALLSPSESPTGAAREGMDDGLLALLYDECPLPFDTGAESHLESLAE